MKNKSKIKLLNIILTGSLIFYIFSGISSVLNYVFYPVIARIVTTSQYGEIQFMVSMFTQLAVGFVVLNILAIIISVKIESPSEQKQAMRNLNIASSIIILLIVAIGSVVLYINKDNLGLTSGISIISLGLSLLVCVPFTVAIGQLQGSGRFITSGIVSMLAAFLKLFFAAFFVVLGFGVTGAILGIGFGMLICLVLLMIINVQTKDKNKKTISTKLDTGFQNLLFIRKQALIAIIAVTVITLLSSADSIVSRVFLGSEQAGQYAAVSTIAKTILAATSPIMWLALPHAVNRNRKQIIKYIKITVVIALTAGALFSTFPYLFVHNLLGINAGSFLELVPLASLSMALCSIGFVLISVSICLYHLRHIAIATIFAIILYLSTLGLFASSAGPLVASIYGQIIAASCFIIGGGLALRSRYFI